MYRSSVHRSDDVTHLVMKGIPVIGSHQTRVRYSRNFRNSKLLQLLNYYA